MKWRVRKLGAKRRALQMWHNWFAWHPVRVPNEGNTMVWLETVRRKGFVYGYTGHWVWKYKNNEQD